MSARLIIRPSAVAELERQADFLADRSPAISERFVNACMADFDRLAETPGKGSMREFQHPKAAGIRSWSITGFPNHLIFYRPVEGGIEVLRVLHGARDINAIFED